MKIKKLLSCTFALAFASNIYADHLSDRLLLSAKLEGSQEVPAVATNAMGVASFVLNAARDSMCVNISVTGLSGPITGAHVHEGDPGMNGAIVIDLSSFISGNRIMAVLTGTNVSVGNVSKFLAGKFYVNVHTSTYPGGEIRGQLMLESDWSFPVMLDGSQEVPAVSTSAYGVGVFNLSKDLSWIKFNAVVQGLSGAILGAHLHYGAMGVSGPVTVNLTPNVNGNVISGVISMPSQALIDSLMAAKVYVNVHTAMNPNGEIRSQLTSYSKYLYFDAALDGAQEVPPVATSARAAATMKLNSTYDTLWYDMAATGLSGAINSAHFHDGIVGVSGPVDHDISADIMGNRIMGKATGSALANGFIGKLLRGQLYLNMHTTANPGGEIRGQVYRLAREGYTFSLDGSQEVPPVSTMANGSGLVSIDRDQDNARYMFTVNGLTPTSAHFHKGVMGVSGPVIYDLSAALINNVAMGFWKSSDATPFTLAVATQFKNDSIYVNVHTSANLAGEIRGQVKRKPECMNFVSGIAETSTHLTNVIVYPNPASKDVTLQFEGKLFIGSITIESIDGKLIFEKQVETAAGQVHIDLRGLAAGTYFIKMADEEQLQVKKLAVLE